MRFNPFAMIEKLPGNYLQTKALDTIFTWAIPFNIGLGLKITKLDNQECIVSSANTIKRKNHVGGAHACFLALMSEYPAGLTLAKRFPPDKYRLIISHLEINYHKQGRGELTAQSKVPEILPVFENGETFIDMNTKIVNKEGQLVSECLTRWQVKEWNKVKTKK